MCLLPPLAGFIALSTGRRPQEPGGKRNSNSAFSSASGCSIQGQCSHWSNHTSQAEIAQPALVYKGSVDVPPELRQRKGDHEQREVRGSTRGPEEHLVSFHASLHVALVRLTSPVQRRVERRGSLLCKGRDAEDPPSWRGSLLCKGRDADDRPLRRELDTVSPTPALRIAQGSRIPSIGSLASGPRPIDRAYGLDLSPRLW
jgi:hypothetical protein